MDEKGTFCSLCKLELFLFPITDGDQKFCCPGCHAVYNILAAKQRLDNYQDSSVFQQALKAGLISNPTLLEQIRKQKSLIQSQETERSYLEITEMWCPSCAEIIRLVLLQQKGVVSCVVDYATDLASVEFCPRDLSKEKIFNLISSLGYLPRSLENAEQKKISLDLYIRCGLASFCALNTMMFAYPLYSTYFDPQAHADGQIFVWLSFFSSLPVVTYCMYPITRRFISSLKVGLLGMEALVIIGVTAAFGLSLYEMTQESNLVYFDSMTIIIAFVLLGKIIETKSKFSAKDSLFRLVKALPRRGRKLFDDGSLTYVPIKEILPGDLLVAYAGEKIVLDGEMTHGSGLCDESLMTGEALPINKIIGSKLLGGSILQHGKITYKVLGNLAESALQKIIDAVELGLEHKSPYVRAADRIVLWFVPLILLIACVTGFLSNAFGDPSAFIKAISVLLIACPCAIGIAAPLAESEMLHQLASHGVIVRNRGCLSLLPRISTFIFDKTGTVTEGHFRLLDGLQHLSSQERSLLKSLVKPSNHLISRALFQAIEEKCGELTHVEECVGKGMKSILSPGVVALLGSAKFFREHHIEVHETHLKQGFSTVYFTPDGRTVYRFVLGDKIREEVPDLIKSLKKTILLSGDSLAPVSFVAEQCGFDDYFHTISPLEKRDFVEKVRKKNEIVCMIGDGVNDAPALTAAHIAISVVSASDISIQVSDILLTTENLKVIPKMLALASKGQRILKQNLFWAFFYNCIGIILAIQGSLSPIFAAIAMTVSSLIVLFNSKRMKWSC